MGFYKQCVIYINEVISEVKAHFRGLINFEIQGETLVIYYDYKSILTGSIMYANIYDRVHSGVSAKACSIQIINILKRTMQAKLFK